MKKFIFLTFLLLGSLKAAQSVEDIVVDELNHKHAIIHADKYYILTEKENPVFGTHDFNLESKQSFKNCYENKVVICSDGKSRTKADVWLKSPLRREYKGIVFDPKKDVKDFYNLWKGFAKVPKKGTCSKYWMHVRENICKENDIAYNYVRKWLAYIFQHPDHVHTALVLCGTQGTGKNSFVEPLGILLGQHYVLLSNMAELVSSFNYHLKHAVLVHANEALWGGNKKELGTLKAIITEQTCMVEGKGKDRFMVRNFKHVIFSSNEAWPVHIDPDDRRFFVLRVSDKRKEDHAYFKAIQEELNNGGYEALLHDLLHEDISSFNPRLIPESPEAFSIKLMSADSSDKYLYDALKEGSFDLGNNALQRWASTYTPDSVYKDYCTWCKTNGERRSIKNQFVKRINQRIPSITTTSRDEQENSPKIYTLPSIAEARSEFQKAFKTSADIWK